MLVADNKVVYIDYVLTDSQGLVIDQSTSHDPLAYIHGHGHIVPGLEQYLLGKKKGDKLQVNLSPAEGYGERDEALERAVPSSYLADIKGLQVGMQLEAQGPEGDISLVTVKSISTDQVVLDGNHPLAGVALNFAVTVVDVRDATDEELHHGHVHGPGGHHH